MIASVRRPEGLRGTVQVPGDKSISHRALILNAVAAGQAKVRGLSPGADVESTAACLRALGAEVDAGTVVGVGLRGLRAAAGALDCGNSGTTMRLLAGLLAGQAFETVLVGDESLSRRPMDRVVAPLRLMGARAELSPLRVGGGPQPLTAVEYEAPVASAQVKSALLLAALYADGQTVIRERVPTRNHTELMLRAMGAPLDVAGGDVSMSPVEELRPLDLAVPGDLSAASFWLVAAALNPRSTLSLPGVGVNPTRSAILRVLARAGLRVHLGSRRMEAAEAVADLLAGPEPDRLQPFDLGAAEAAALIDELPVLAVAATQLPGTSRVTGAAELRLKESDRVAAMTDGLSAMGASIRELADGWEISGPSFLEGVRVESRGDHRVAMALAVAGLLADGTTEIVGAECVDISYPGFWEQLAALC